jgi:hypothetical protein
MDEPERQIAALREQLRSLETLRPILGDALSDQKKTELEARLALVETGGGAFIGGNVNTGGGKVVGRDDRSVIIGGDARHVLVITGDGNQIAVSVDQVSTDELLRGYYRALAQECRRLPLGVVDPRFAQPGAKGEVSLVEVYTDLDVVSAPRAADEASERWGLRLARGEGGERTSLLQAITEPSARRLVLVGDAGSGKTTFVNYLAYGLAEALIGGTPLPLPEALRGLLPVRLILRRAARWVPENSSRGCAELLWQALRADVTERLGEAAAERLVPTLQQRLLTDGGLVLLDGLDEVPAAARRRGCLLESIQEFVAGLPADRSRVLLTARPHAYADPRWHLTGVSGAGAGALSPGTESSISSTAGTRPCGPPWVGTALPPTPARAGCPRRYSSASAPIWPTWRRGRCC